MNEIYGHQWASQQGDEPNDTWVRGCSDLSNKDLGAGLRALMDRGEAWPPSLPEFRKLCQGGGEEWERRCHRPFDELPPPVDLGEGRYLPAPEDHRTPEEHLSAMKTLLGA